MAPRFSAGELTAAVIGLVGTRGPLSRAEAARILDVSPATITAATKELLESGVLIERGTVASAGGRPGTLLDINHGRREALGVKITPNHLTMARVDLAGNTQPPVSLNLDTASADAPLQICAAIRAQVETGRDSLLGIGLAIPGFVDSQDSGRVTSPILGWQQVPLGSYIRDEVKLPVFIDNDVNALAVAARLYDPEPLPSDYVLITIGYGIGCALVANGQVYRGARGGAGELGHVLVDPGGPPCQCGLRGCLESFIGDNALALRARTLGLVGPQGTKDDLNAAAQADLPGARDLFADAGRVLGRVVASLVQVSDPELVVVSGEGVDMWHLWEPAFSEELHLRMPRHRLGMRVAARPWDETTWAKGAASLVFDSPFDAGRSGTQGRRVRAMLREGA